MCLMPHNKAKAQSGLKSFHVVSHGVLSWWLHTEQQCWPEETLGPALCSQLSHSSFYGGTTAWSWRLVKLALPKCNHSCLLQGGEGGETKGWFWTGYFSWEMNSLISVFLYQFLNCYPLLLLTFLPFACGCQNVCNIFRVGVLSKKKRNLALKRTWWQKKRK